jgi:hypothetical protein
MGTTGLDDETTLPPPTAPAAGCAIVGSGTANPERHHVPDDGFRGSFARLAGARR